MQSTRITRRLGRYPEERELVVAKKVWCGWKRLEFRRSANQFDHQRAFEDLVKKYPGSIIRDLR